MTHLCSLNFWFEAILCVIGLSIIPVLLRQKNCPQQRDDWWAKGRGEIFEFSRCLAVYTFVQFFTILFLTSYTLEVEDQWGKPPLVYFMAIILYATVQNY